MKVDGKTIPAPQNIRRREAFLLTHADKLPTKYLQAQLLKIAIVKAQKNLRWEMPTKLKSREERMEETTRKFTPVKKEGFISRIKKAFK